MSFCRCCGFTSNSKRTNQMKRKAIRRARRQYFVLVVLGAAAFGLLGTLTSCVRAAEAGRQNRMVRATIQDVPYDL